MDDAESPFTRPTGKGSRSLTAGGDAKRYSHFAGQLLTKRNTLLAHDPAIMLLGIYPNELQTVSTQKPEGGCWWQLYLYLPKLGSNRAVLLEVNG